MVWPHPRSELLEGRECMVCHRETPHWFPLLDPSVPEVILNRVKYGGKFDHIIRSSTKFPAKKCVKKLSKKKMCKRDKRLKKRKGFISHSLTTQLPGDGDAYSTLFLIVPALPGTKPSGNTHTLCQTALYFNVQKTMGTTIFKYKRVTGRVGSHFVLLWTYRIEIPKN